MMLLTIEFIINQLLQTQLGPKKGKKWGRVKYKKVKNSRTKGGFLENTKHF